MFIYIIELLGAFFIFYGFFLFKKNTNSSSYKAKCFITLGGGLLFIIMTTLMTFPDYFDKLNFNL